MVTFIIFCDLKHTSVKTDNFHPLQTDATINQAQLLSVRHRKVEIPFNKKARLKDKGAYYVLSESFRCGAVELKA